LQRNDSYFSSKSDGNYYILYIILIFIDNEGLYMSSSIHNPLVTNVVSSSNSLGN